MRAITLVATVLLSASAATTSLVIIKQSIDGTRAESLKTDYGRATNAAVDARAEFERELLKDPEFYNKKLFRLERPRLCSATIWDTEGYNKWIKPATEEGAEPTVWDSSKCGTSWVYPQPGAQISGWSYLDHPVRAEITAPSSTDPNLTLTILSSAGQAETGIKAIYKRTSLTDSWNIWSEKNLDLNNILIPETETAKTLTSAAVYSGGTLSLPTEGTVTQNRFYAEGRIYGKPAGSPLMTRDPQQSQWIEKTHTDISVAIPTPLTTSTLASSTLLAENIACPQPGSSANLSGNKTASLLTGGPSAGLATFQCLRSGWTVWGKATTSSGEGPLAVPDAAAWLIMPLNSQDKQTPELAVFYIPQNTTPTTTGRCSFSCNPRKEASKEVQAGTHIASNLTSSNGQVWNLLGFLKYPAAGVIATDNDTYVSHCKNFHSPADINNPKCDPETDLVGTGDLTYTPADGGVVFPQSLTIIAGSVSSPADLYISGPISTDPVISPGGDIIADTTVGLVSTGKTIIPYYSAPDKGTLNIKAGILALNLAQEDTPGIQTLPYGASNSAETMRLNIQGTLAGDSIGKLYGVTSANLSSDPTLTAVQPPYFPGFSTDKQRVQSDIISSSEVCGGTLGQLGSSDGQQSAIVTCYGLW